MGLQRRSKPLPAGGILTDAKRHSMDGTIQAGDVVVSHLNGTRDFYIIATVRRLSTVRSYACGTYCRIATVVPCDHFE